MLGGMLLLHAACAPPPVESTVPCAASQACIDGGEAHDPFTDQDPETTPVDANDTADPAPVGDTEDPDPVEDPDVCTTVTFVEEDRTIDLTNALTKGLLVQLEEPGTLEVCPGTWFAQLHSSSEVVVAGLGHTREQTVLSGGEQVPVFTVHGGSLTARNLVVDRGAAWTDGSYGAGGGLRCEAARVTLSNVTLSQNQAYDGGAGLVGPGCELTVTHADIVDNVATDDGGAFRVSDGGLARFEDVRFAGNAARDGGALAIFEGRVEVTTSLFEDNTAGDYGGALSNWYGQLQIGSSVLQENQARFGGGLSLAGTTALERVVLQRHDAEQGGAILFHDIGRLEGRHTSFSDNAPDDVAVQGSSQSYTWSDASNFACDGGQCLAEP